MNKEQRKFKKTMKQRNRRAKYERQKNETHRVSSQKKKERYEKIKDFDEKYRVKGGVGRLILMREALTPQDDIASHFGVVKERVRQWMVEFFGEEYDPRKDRRERRIEAMVETLTKKGEYEFIRLYKEDNKEYREEAVRRFRKLQRKELPGVAGGSSPSGRRD